MVLMNLSQSSSRDADTEKRLMNKGRGKRERVRQMERVAGMHIH